MEDILAAAVSIPLSMLIDTQRIWTAVNGIGNICIRRSKEALIGRSLL